MALRMTGREADHASRGQPAKSTHTPTRNLRISAHSFLARFGYSLLSQSNAAPAWGSRQRSATMSAQDNAVLARRIYQLFSEDKFDDVLELVSEDIEAILVPFGQTFHGREGFMQFMHGFKGAFPDLRISVTNQVATDESVVSEFTARGTHNGPLLTPAGEVPPTGRTVDFIVCEVVQVKHGQIASLHNYQDAASLMRQLGLLA